MMYVWCIFGKWSGWSTVEKYYYYKSWVMWIFSHVSERIKSFTVPQEMIRKLLYSLSAEIDMRDLFYHEYRWLTPRKIGHDKFYDRNLKYGHISQHLSILSAICVQIRINKCWHGSLENQNKEMKVGEASVR